MSSWESRVAAHKAEREKWIQGSNKSPGPGPYVDDYTREQRSWGNNGPLNGRDKKYDDLCKAGRLLEHVKSTRAMIASGMYTDKERIGASADRDEREAIEILQKWGANVSSGDITELLWCLPAR